MDNAGASSGQKVGEIYYEVTLDTQKMIDGQRQVDTAVDKVSAKLTETAQAAKAYVHETGMAAKQSKEFEEQARKLGMTAGQLKAATRGLPAQFTDIATSLAAGQNPLTVFLQQGGQLKDMFGGVNPAFRAMAGYIAGLVNPLTVAAAAAGVFIYSLVKGGQEFQDFNRTLELTGYQSGVTANQLVYISKSMDSMAGVTQGQAAEALNTFIQLGIKGSDGLQRFAEAAIELESVGGPAVAETAKAFRELEKDPLKASIKLNEATGFLTEEIYKQIKALEESGSTTDAARLAQEAYADTINSRTPKIAEQLGLIERMWRGIKNATREAGDALLSIGRDDSLQSKLDSARAQRDEMLTRRGVSNKDAKVAAINGRIAELELAIREEDKLARISADRQKGVKASIEQDKARDAASAKYATNEERRLKELEKYRQQGILTPELEARVNKTYKDKGKGGGKFSPEAYLEDLRGKAAVTDSQRAESEAAKALEINKKLLADGRISREQSAEAEVLIEQRKQQQLLEINGKSAARVNELRLSLMRDGEEKIEAVRLESIRKINEAEKAGLMTSEQAQLERQKVEQDAQDKRDDRAERGLVALAESRIAITEDEASRITLIHDESVRQAEAAYKRGESTFAEMEARKVLAAQKSKDDIAKLQQSRDAVRIQTLEIRAQTTGGAEDKAALIRAQAEEEFKAVMDAQEKDLSNMQLYEDKKAAIRNRMNQQLLENQAATDIAVYAMAQSSAGQVLDVLRRAGKERTTLGKALFLSERALAVATIITQTEVAAAKAKGIAGPFGVPMATWIRSTGYASAGMVAGMAIADTFGGGRQYGGPVSADKMYRVNETGQPEMFTAANGRQYMMPNARGEVTPANELGGGKVQISVQVINNHSGADVSVKQDDTGRVVQIAISEIAGQISNNSGQVWQAMRSSTNIEGRM